jgi:hypothetical protein
MLSVFDSLANWARGMHPPFEAERVVKPRQKDCLADHISKRFGIIIPVE